MKAKMNQIKVKTKHFRFIKKEKKYFIVVDLLCPILALIK